MFKLGSKKDLNTEYKCTIRLLDDTEVLQCDFQHLCKGQYILDYVCNALNLLEKDYFGLRYVDSHKQRHWLDITKPIMKQVKGMNPLVFCFRVKFYPQDPFRLKEEITRYQMFLQLRRDLLHGRLYCSQNDAAMLAALVIQSELGDYDAEEHTGNYVAEFKLLLKQTPRIEEKIAEIHQQQLRGQVPAVAETNFLRKACLLETYGVDPHPVKDHKGNQLYLGINHAGILTFQGSRKTHHFKWPDIQKINYEGKMFILHLMFPEDIKAKKKHLMGFKCPTQTACHHLWRCAVEQRYFFTVPSSSEVPSVTTGGGLFSRGSRFRYSGRVEREVMDDMKNIRRDPPQFQRTLTRPPSFRCKTTASIAAPSLSPSRAATEDSPLREMMHPTMADQTLRAAAPLDCGDGYLPDDAKRPADPHELLDSADDEEDGVPLPLARPPNHDLRVDLTPSQSSTTVAAPPDAPLTPETQSPEPPFDPQSTPECGPELEARLRGSGCAWHATGGTRPRLALVAWLALPLVLLWCLFVALMEWDWPPLSDMRRLPELVLVRRQYYEPTKEALFAWIRGTPEET
ncbi:FERM domain-containing protein 5 isoform X1 [Ixodes scapularis]|uniref:FERM domain-containing protein 5 isoform X1 n=1 Tax=Ixodes scapularis TaxID=6945 RepID=UPI001161AC55|nr:FERM domain-containing protein 5 isoform X1 [Ixodes scapularis]